MVTYAFIVIVAFLVSTAVVIVLIICAPLVENDGDDPNNLPVEMDERTDGSADAAPSVGASQVED